MDSSEKNFNLWSPIVKTGKGIIGFFQIPQSTTMDPAERKLKVYEIIVKGIIGAFVAGVVTIIGFRMESSRTKLAQQEESNRVKLAQEMESNRVMIAENNKALMALRDSSVKQKEMDLDLGMKMFQTLMSHYLQVSTSQGGSERSHQQMVLLHLISLNFQDSPINIKPLFEELDRQMTNAREKEQLREIAMEVARHQAFRLTFQNGTRTDATVEKDSEIPLDIQATIKIIEVGQDVVKASLISEATLEKPTLGPFTVSFFDMPLIDNIKLGEKRVSLLLLKNDGKTARVRVLVFDSFLAPDRFDVREATRLIQDPKGTK
jgi:hypothetical protein